MARLSAVVLALALGSARAGEFSNVTHLETTVIAFGVATTTGDDMYVPGSNGNTVGVYQSHDGGASVAYDVIGEEVNAAILMTAAGSSHDQNVVVAGLLGAGYSADGGATWLSLDFGTDKPVAPVTQDAKYDAKSDVWSLVGTFQGQGGVAVSTSGANGTFAAHPITPGLTFNEQSARYGAFPSADTFFVTLGFWGADETEAEQRADAAEGLTRVTKTVALRKDGTIKSRSPVPGAAPKAGFKKAGAGDEPAGAWGQVVKTSDGGATWSLVWEDVDSGLYPNDIHCFDTNTCAFTLDASGTGALPKVVTTTDGGATWVEHEFGTAGDTLMGVRMVSTTELWASGGSSAGEMWHTENLGGTWDKFNVAATDAASLFSFALTPDGTAAYATGILRSQLCSILKIEF